MSLTDNKKNKPKMANIELLRCIAMMMVVVLHYLGKSSLLVNLTSERMESAGVAAWVLESFCIVAVNVYMLISGYFLCESSFKLSRLLKLLLQVFTYSVVIGLVAAVLGLVPAEELTTYYFVQILFPVSMGHYWFLTAYVFLYLLLPFLTMAVKRMTKGQMQLALGLLLFAFCVLKSILPVRLDMDEKGYDCLWYICVFLVAAYIRRFGIPFLQKKGRGITIYLLSVALIFAGTFALRFVYLKTGSLGLLLSVCMEYNHVLVLLASVGLFAAFLRVHVSDKISGVICRIAPYTLGVYLLHENLGVRYAWQKWLGAEQVSNVGMLLLFTLLAVIIVFTVGILAEYLRTVLMKGLHKVFMHVGVYRVLMDKLAAADGLFAEKG
ncbi:MAG: acyltransferase [Lachnospiraceae bacterium]|nr:acyltransferase [Lachnospiraceae bacterium]